jgi:hypothetical protein
MKQKPNLRRNPSAEISFWMTGILEFLNIK